MNQDQLLDAIGMVDEQKIRDAVMVKRTKRMTGVLTVLVILVAAALLLSVIGGLLWLFDKTVVAYPTSRIADDIDNANVVTVTPDPADPSTMYALYAPHGTSDAMRFEEWQPVDEQELKMRKERLHLRFHDTSLVFYDGGYVRARKYDWDEYVGTYAVPEGLWQEVLAFLAKDGLRETYEQKGASPHGDALFELVCFVL